MCVAQVAVAVLDGVEAGLGAEHREPGGPDVRRDQHPAAPGGLQHDLQQIAAVEAQDRPPVGVDVADGDQRPVQGRRGLQVGQADQVVHLARPLAVLVDVADLHGQHEAHVGGRAGARDLRRQLRRQLGPQRQQPAAVVDEPLLQLCEPARVGEVAGPHQADALALSPDPEVLEVELLARRPGEARVDVQVGHQLHGPLFAQIAGQRKGLNAGQSRARPGRAGAEKGAGCWDRLPVAC